MTPIRAVLAGSDRCAAEGMTLRANAPVLAMCRALIQAGFDPATPLHAYRGDTLCLTVTSIGWGARHTVREDERVGPFLRRWTPFPMPRGDRRLVISDPPVGVWPAPATLILAAAAPMLERRCG
jgi:hypothetical protein